MLRPVITGRSRERLTFRSIKTTKKKVSRTGMFGVVSGSFATKKNNKKTRYKYFKSRIKSLNPSVGEAQPEGER